MSISKKAWLLIAIIFVPLFIGLIFFRYEAQDNKEEKTKPELTEMLRYVSEINDSRKQKDIDFADSTTSRFNREERSTFHGLNYFPPDPAYRVEVKFSIDTSTPVFKMPTNTERTPNYRIYGYLDFEIHDTNCRLTAFQNMDYINDPEDGKYLFVPFSDKTNGNGSYGAGRYIDILIPAENNIVLDFNEAYNPYCAYSDRWSCPLVPFENYLEVNIPAGEKKYTH